MSRSMKCWLFVAAVTTLLTAGFAHAQMPFPPVGAPPVAVAPPPPAPLMFVRFNGPKGTKIIVCRGTDAGQTLELPVTVGFRPGYAYRLAVFDLPNLPRQFFSPSFEIRGTLALTPKMRNEDFPAHVYLNEDDFGRALTGSLIKKVVTLEHPERSIPVATKADEPLEIPVTGTRDPYLEAIERGAPLIIMHLGGRFVTPQELNAMGVPGTVLLPGERFLGSPRIPPYLLWSWCPVLDPVHGPRPTAEFLRLPDGGDVGLPAGVTRDGKLKGLDPTDTIAEYTDSKGVKRIAISNRVAVCVPRFITFTGESGLAKTASRIGLNNAAALTTPAASAGQVALQQQQQRQSPEAVGTQIRLSGLMYSSGTSVVGRIQGLEVKSSLKHTDSVDGLAGKAADVEPADGPLRIIKWPDKACVNVGEIVTFYLKYSNTGGQPITNVVVSDSLTTRLEYVKGSTKTDRDAVFTMEPNEAGSSILRWEFTAPLARGESGLITFQVRVR